MFEVKNFYKSYADILAVDDLPGSSTNSNIDQIMCLGCPYVADRNQPGSIITFGNFRDLAR